MARSEKYQDFLIRELKNDRKALAYLNTALEESLKGDPESELLFLVAIKNVAEARGGISLLAKKTGMGRESLYKCLSGKVNPKWHTLVALVAALGLKLYLGD